jgi:hypothetical protein
MWLLGGRQGLDELYGAGPKQFDQAKTPTLPELLLALPQVGEAFEPIKHEEDLITWEYLQVHPNGAFILRKTPHALGSEPLMTAPHATRAMPSQLMPALASRSFLAG